MKETLEIVFHSSEHLKLTLVVIGSGCTYKEAVAVLGIDIIMNK